ncbi:MAG: sulfurtransferase [Vicinamibacterales bacterium]
MYTTLISPDLLAKHLDDPDWVVIDCRFDLTAPPRGEEAYAAGHVPGARYAHLDRDLSAPMTGTNGRHPLPSPGAAAATFGRLGIRPGTQVVAYDGDTGMFAVRLWWMLRWLGHDAVAVLDGGFAAWTAAALPTRSGAETWAPAEFVAAPREEWCLSADQVARTLGDPAITLVDARTNDRYRGIGETLDPVGGHIPGAVNHWFGRNLTEQKTFKSPDALRAEWAQTLAGTPPTSVVMYCGSGVTACHNLLALEHAGLEGARIYPGSWSEWCSNPDRPTETETP